MLLTLLRLARITSKNHNPQSKTLSLALANEYIRSNNTLDKVLIP